MSESKRKRIEGDDQEASLKYTELEYQAMKKEIVQLKQTMDEDCDRERDRDRIVEDISQLLVTGKWSDVTISVDGKNFALHRAILSARSSIFADLLEENCKENRLVINEVDVDIFEILVSFIYTGKVPTLEPKMAQDLLTAADKYKLEQLKSTAEDYLCDQLSDESVAILLPFAEAVNAAKLKDKCLELTNRFASSSTTPRSLPPVARLHDPCLVALFKQLPPADKMTARTVCFRWADLVPYAARSTSSLAILINQDVDAAESQLNRFSHGSDWELLQLLDKEDGTPLYRMHSLTQWNSLEFSTLDEATITAITATFPVLKELQLAAQFNQDDHCCTAPPPLSIIDHLIRLLDHWRPQLTTLKLHIWSSFEDASSCSRLSAAINSLFALKHLTFDLDWNGTFHCPPLSILPQLTHFTTNSHEFAHMLRQCSPLKPDIPLQISFVLEESFEWDSIIDQLTSLAEDLRRHFGHLDDCCFPDYRTVYRHFPCLTTVHIAPFDDATIRDILMHASQLTQLIYLQLEIDFRHIRPDDQPHLLLPQLKSVKLLQLEISRLPSHRHLEQLNLAWTMPNVQVIVLRIYPLECTLCGIPSQPNPNPNKAKHCLHQMFAPLACHCAKLHTIKHNHEEEFGTTEEILAEPIIEVALPPTDTEPSDVLANNLSDEHHQAMNSD